MDGTLLPWDTQYVFSCFVLRLHPWRRLLVLLFLACIPLYVLRIWDENRMKRAYLIYLWGLPAETVREYGRKFGSLAQEWIYPELKERLEEHRKKGDLCLMVSASPTFYAEPLGELLGFDGSSGNGRASGRPHAGDAGIAERQQQGTDKGGAPARAEGAAGARRSG